MKRWRPSSRLSGAWRLLKSGHTRVLLAGLGAAALLLAGFWLSQPVQVQQHTALITHLAGLQTDESRLGREVLRLNFGLADSYDTVTALMHRLDNGARALESGPLTLPVQNHPEFARERAKLQARLQVKAVALDRFKSLNAELRNSLHYLPAARDALVARLPLGSRLHDSLDAVLEAVLLARASGSLLERDTLDTLTPAIQTALPSQSEEVQVAVRQFLRHATHALALTQQLQSLSAELTQPAPSDTLAQIYQRIDAQHQRASGLYRLSLLAVALCLLGYAVSSMLRLRIQTQRLRLAATVFHNANEGITLTDAHGTILDVNPSFSRVTGYSHDEAVGRNPRIMHSGRQDAAFYARMWQAIGHSDHWEGEIWNRRKSGEVYPEWLRIQAVRSADGGAISHYIATFTDLTQHKRNQAEIERLAHYDPLTHCANRRLLLERTRQTLSQRRTQPDLCALLALDLDHFALVNELHGASVGDAWLEQVADTLGRLARAGDTVARLDGDDFAVLLPGLGGDDEAAARHAVAVADKLRAALVSLAQADKAPHSGQASVGVALSWPDADADTLLANARAALQQAKANGRDNTALFNPDLRARLRARAQLEADLRTGLHEGQLALHFQEQVMPDGQATGAEVLVRWQHPQRGLVGPTAFIPLAEETGLIRPLGRWVLQAACAQLRAWADDPRRAHLVLAVNVSVVQIKATGYVEEVRKVLADTGANPDRLKLEITESMLLDDVDSVLGTLHALRALGCSISLDDFGTGYSSLQYLKRLPLQQIKIDQSFVRGLPADDSDRTLVRTIIAMANSLGLATIAEGVETVAQRDALLNLGCCHFQGYLYARPQPLAAFEALLDAPPSLLPAPVRPTES